MISHLGKWVTDSELLLKAFPDATVVVYVAAEIKWQTEVGRNAKLRVEIVERAWRGWVSVWFRELTHFGTPTLVVWRGAYGARPKRMAKRLVNTLLKLSLPIRRVVLTRSLRDCCVMLASQPAIDDGIRSRSEIERVADTAGTVWYRP